ncbi:MAG: hypothetical protein A2474_00205 [Elusimicrobia bacterium RIFOXYC2_FULL_34_12]|nr:MAG: hypothetical protein A2474_00205 [Elusimicrobia bacterium RIFOXYC2_FULL_34_12]OGS37982.1 MAG: hypothetical protein A2551_04805 [Elusimicrobia bacterium RIFOXYD2_FULL_34_30]
MKKIFSFVFYTLFLFTVCLAAAKIDSFSGKVTINGFNAVVGQKLNLNDLIKTSFNSKALISINGHKVNVSPKTEAIVADLADDNSLLKIIVGRIRAAVNRLKTRQKFEIKTPTAICAVRGTDFAVEVQEDLITRLEVYEGIVAAKEETTGSEVLVNPGEFTTIQKGEAPKEPEKMEEDKKDEETEDKKDDFKSEAQREIFMEISRESVMERAAEEIKLAEYQNGKALIDVYGKRVRLEEYVYRPPENKAQFKYVVLNERENRFDFGKILFTFNKELPTNLNDATKNMFHSEGSTQPEWYLSGLDSVMSNTYDKILEEASGGKMVADDSATITKWNLFFPNYKFYIGNADSTENSGKGKLMWQFVDNGDNIPQKTEFTFLPGTQYESNTDPAVSSFNLMPDGINTFHFAYKDVYADNNWVEKHNYLINDDGVKQQFSDIVDSENVSSDKIKEKILTLNFQNVYTSSLFTDKNSVDDGFGKRIDLIFSSKLLSDSGILSLPSVLSQ